MTGAEYVAAFLARVGVENVFVLTGGACAFMIDAVSLHPSLKYTCFLHEQSAAMAADAVWRVRRRVGVTMATSGPGATNLITGIACSYFDSIPTLHITGQVNQRESSSFQCANVRQTGFQETKIVEMVRPITKYAVMVKSTSELRQELSKAYAIATSGRMGPVLIDIPMDVQQAEMDSEIDEPFAIEVPSENVQIVAAAVSATLAAAHRPVVLWGGGIGLAGVELPVLKWLGDNGLPFVSSWAGLTSFDHDHPGFLGQIGVYGNRGANFVLQNADAVLVIGSRLDNRQRSGNASTFAIGAAVHVLDIDDEELKKYAVNRYRTNILDFRAMSEMLQLVAVPRIQDDWLIYTKEMKQRYNGSETSSSARRLNTLSPYEVVRKLNAVIAENAIVVGDTGAAVCWLHQAFRAKRHSLFTAGGNSPMGYGLPAAIGAKISEPTRQVVSFIGDGGFQLNIQELQTIKQYGLDIAIIVMNNGNYGIIKQFQDSYLESRYSASQDGYGVPDFGALAAAYGLDYERVDSLDRITPDLLQRGPIIIDVIFHEATLIEPKLEMGRPINDQFPYLDAAEYAAGNRFVSYSRPDTLVENVAQSGLRTPSPTRGSPS